MVKAHVLFRVMIVLLAAVRLDQSPGGFATRTNDPAHQVIATAAQHMGGIDQLRAVEQVSLTNVTQWLRWTLNPLPQPPVISYEWTTELRDYRIPAWRAVGRPTGADPSREIVNLVRDSVAVLYANGRWTPQNGALVDERDEVFTFTPERLIVSAFDASDAQALSDTVISGSRMARVVVKVGRFRPTLYFRRTDGLPALVDFRAAQPLDMGLVSMGDMDVAVWYSNWRRFPPGILLPTQLDVYRGGVPYKRMTYTDLKLNPSVPPDSFVVDDSLRSRFFNDPGRTRFIAFGPRPMFDLPLDSTVTYDGRFLAFKTNGFPVGAVKLGDGWLIIEGGVAPLTMSRAVDLLKHSTADRVHGALVTLPAPTGGVVWLLQRGTPVWATSGAAPYVHVSLRGWKQSPTLLRIVGPGSPLRFGRDSIVVATVDLPDNPASSVLYVPSLRWAYCFGSGALPYVLALIRQRGWAVDRVGSVRSFYGTPLPADSGR